MSRPMTVAAAAQLGAQAKAPVFLMEGQFVSGPVNVWTGIGMLSWNGKDWDGLGTLVGIENISESTDPTAQQTVITLSGVDPTALALALIEVGHNLPATIWLGFLDSSGALIVDPIKLFSGLMDVPQIVETVSGPQLRIAYANRLADLERPRLRNYTSEDQALTSPDDRGFDFVPAAQEWNGNWGGNP